MNVSDVMTANPRTISPNSTLQNSLGKMLQIRCHHLPVLSKEKHLVGIISDYDCHKALSENTDQNLHVSDVMTPAPIIIEPNASVEEAARLMLNHNIRCLPVMRGETLIGIITTSDLLIAFMQLSGSTRQSSLPNTLTFIGL